MDRKEKLRTIARTLAYYYDISEPHFDDEKTYTAL